jgi:hypothetical protein
VSRPALSRIDPRGAEDLGRPRPSRRERRRVAGLDPGRDHALAAEAPVRLGDPPLRESPAEALPPELMADLEVLEVGAGVRPAADPDLVGEGRRDADEPVGAGAVATTPNSVGCGATSAGYSSTWEWVVIDIDVVCASFRMSVSIGGPSAGSIGRRRNSVAVARSEGASITPRS